MRMLLILLCFLLGAIPAKADMNPNQDITLTLPDALGMADVTDHLSINVLQMLSQISAPNRMTNLFFPVFYLEENAINKRNHEINLPDDLVIFAVPKGNPTVKASDFHKLKAALRPKLEQAGATIFANEQLWMGATKTHQMTDKEGQKKTYIFSTDIIAIKDKVVMLQFLHLYKKGDDLELFHQMMASLAQHIITTNGYYQDQTRQKQLKQLPKIVVPNIKKK